MLFYANFGEIVGNRWRNLTVVKNFSTENDFIHFLIYLTCQSWQGKSEGEQYNCEMHGSVILAHLLEVPLQFTVFIVLQIEKWKILLNLVYPPIIKLNSLLHRPACKQQKYLSEDFIYLHYLRGYRIVNFSEKTKLLQY